MVQLAQELARVDERLAAEYAAVGDEPA
jgi:hypothetical protein